MTPPRLSVLVIHGDTTASDSPARIVALTGHVAHVAGRCADALTAADQFAPDVLLLVLPLPDRDGCDLVERVCDTLGYRPLVVELSGQANGEARPHHPECDHHLLMPMQRGILADLLDSYAEDLLLAGR